jgi:hypothetical protein
VVTAPIRARPSSTASGTHVVPASDPGTLHGAAAATVTVSSTCVSVGVFLSGPLDFPRVPVTSMRTGLLARSDRRRQAAVRQIDGAS